MEFEVGDVVTSSYYSDNSNDQYKIIRIVKDKWASEVYILESLTKGTRMERAKYQISHSPESKKGMNAVCDCGGKNIKDAGHVHWCESQKKTIEKELKYL